MPKAKVLRNTGQGNHADPTMEDRIAAACQWVKENSKRTPTAAAAKFGVPYYTFRRRFLGLTKSRAAAHEPQRLLSENQEKVLIDWVKYWGEQGRGLTRDSLRAKVKDLCGKLPSK
ncbi:hypothetical protein BD414DRAFT_398191, partial [Trametes punicea]